MKIIKDYPPNYADIILALPDVADRKGVVFTYGDKIYAPKLKGKLSKDIKIHEHRHCLQQGEDPAGWWNKYLQDPEFRLSQELDAYRVQYVYFLDKNYDVNKRKNFLRNISEILSGPIYGKIINQEEAINLILTVL